MAMLNYQRVFILYTRLYYRYYTQFRPVIASEVTVLSHIFHGASVGNAWLTNRHPPQDGSELLGDVWWGISSLMDCHEMSWIFMW